MDERPHHSGERQLGPDMLPLTSGNPLAPFQREHDVHAGPQRTGTILLTTVGSLLLIALVAWLSMR